MLTYNARKFNLFLRQLLFYGVSLLTVNLLLWFTVWVKRPMSMFRFLGQKNPMSNSDSDVSLFTRIMMQRWHINSLGIVLSETIVTVSLSAPPTVAHIRRWADISHITSQIMLGRGQLLMLAISHLLHVWGAAVRHLPFSGADSPSETEYAIVHERTSHQCIAGRHRPHSQQQLQENTYDDMAPAVGQTMQISDNYFNDGHLPPERPLIDSQSATKCRHAVHHT